MKRGRYRELNLPTKSDVATALLRLLSGRDVPTETVRVYAELADQFELSQHDRHAAFVDTKDSAWEWLVRRAKQDLKDKGLIRETQRGSWILTKRGRVEAQRPTLTLEDLEED
jgi:restriction endonuclease Mrr